MEVVRFVNEAVFVQCNRIVELLSSVSEPLELKYPSTVARPRPSDMSSAVSCADHGPLPRSPDPLS